MEEQNIVTNEEKLKNEIKKLQIQTRVFWLIISALVGFCAGIFFAQNIVINKQLDNSVKLKGIVINSIPYDLKERM